jgi:FtsP/CotA-like multicopper oxidase with cupredoxin domain
MRKNESLLVSFVAAGLAILGLLVASIALGTKNSGGSAASGGGEGSVIDVTLKEFSIIPAHLMAPPGPLKIRVTNSGAMAHDFEVAGFPKTRLLNPGESETLDLGNLSSGSFTITCTVPGHAASGMVADLMIQPGVVAGGTQMETMTNEEMDTVMEFNAKRFPEKTSATGGQLLEPTIQPDGTKQYDLVASIVDWEIEKGKVVKAWTYNGMVPGPEIRVEVGDKVRIMLKNELPETTSLHLHGIRVPNTMDGVDPYTQRAIRPGEIFEYAFTAREPAVGMYHSHHNGQIQIPNGLAGAIYVGKMPIPTAKIGNVNITKEVTMVLNDAGNIGLSLNGKSFPATEPYVMKVGDSMLVHYYNEGLQIHPMHMHQPHGWVIAKDGKPLESPYMVDTLNVAPGERYTVVYSMLDKGVWAWHCHILNHAEGPTGMFGMVTAVIVQ